MVCLCRDESSGQSNYFPGRYNKHCIPPPPLFTRSQQLRGLRGLVRKKRRTRFAGSCMCLIPSRRRPWNCIFRNLLSVGLWFMRSTGGQLATPLGVRWTKDKHFSVHANTYTYNWVLYISFLYVAFKSLTIESPLIFAGHAGEIRSYPRSHLNRP